MENGYIKIFRSILGWEWYQDSNTKAVFLHLLLNANWEETRYRGVVVPRGSLIAGRKSIAHDLGMTERAVRTSLDHLKSTGEVTIQSTNRFSVITIVNWDNFQGVEEKATSQMSSQRSGKRPATDQQPTTYKEYKEYKNIRSEEVYTRIWDAYNSVCSNFRRCHSLTKPRISKLDELLDVYSVDEIIEVFRKANGMPYLSSGKNKLGWTADFDWLIDIKNFVKVEDGRYETQEKSYQSNYDFDELERMYGLR